MRTSIYISFLVLLGISHNPLFAEVMIYGIEIPGLHQSDGAGAYDQLITETVINSGLASLAVYPPAKAKNKFSECQNCCFSPANKNPEFYEFSENFTQTDPMNTAKIYIFVNKGQPPISRLEGLQNKKVGIRFGMPYGKSFEEANLTTYTVYKLEGQVRLIQNGRIDAFVAYVPDVYKMFRELNLEPFPHNVSRPIAVHPDRLVCKGVKLEFINIFNEMLQKQKMSGRLKNILGKNYIAE